MFEKGQSRERPNVAGASARKVMISRFPGNLDVGVGVGIGGVVEALPSLEMRDAKCWGGSWSGQESHWIYLPSDQYCSNCHDVRDCRNDFVSGNCSTQVLGDTFLHRIAKQWCVNWAVAERCTSPQGIISISAISKRRRTEAGWSAIIG
jgi:hypothetical protein